MYKNLSTWISSIKLINALSSNAKFEFKITKREPESFDEVWKSICLFFSPISTCDLIGKSNFLTVPICLIILLDFSSEPTGTSFDEIIGMVERIIEILLCKTICFLAIWLISSDSIFDFS